MIKGIKFATIPVRDQKKALKFYTQKLGFELKTDEPFGPGLRWIELEIPGAETEIVLFTPQGHESRIGSFSGIAFTCNDVQNTYEELKARGVEFKVPPKKEAWGTQCQFVDPDGNQFLISSN
jgi:catechol 2,3-dioxygenase-like lactoylglutathione lyase family enzyme